MVFQEVTETGCEMRSFGVQVYASLREIINVHCTDAHEWPYFLVRWS